MGTGRSDYPNQVNNVLAFPGIFRGALDVRARKISEGMKLAAARAIADIVGERAQRGIRHSERLRRARRRRRSPKRCGRAAIDEGLARRTRRAADEEFAATVVR